MSKEKTNDQKEIKGIIYLIPPIKVNYSEWAFDHPDCDTIIKRDETNSDEIIVLCYAKSKDYNVYLRDVRKVEFPDDMIMVGVDSREVYCID